MEIKEQIIVLIKSQKSKTINIKEIRENLNLEYTPQNEKILKNEIEKLVQERYIVRLVATQYFKNNILSNLKITYFLKC